MTLKKFVESLLFVELELVELVQHAFDDLSKIVNLIIAHTHRHSFVHELAPETVIVVDFLPRIRLYLDVLLDLCMD